MKRSKSIAAAIILIFSASSSFALGLHNGSGSRSFFRNEAEKAQQGVAQPPVQEMPTEAKVAKSHKSKKRTS